MCVYAFGIKEEQNYVACRKIAVTKINISEITQIWKDKECTFLSHVDPGFIFFVIRKTSWVIWETKSAEGGATVVHTSMDLTQQVIHLM